MNHAEPITSDAAQGKTTTEALLGSTMLLRGNVTISSAIPSFIPADQEYYWSGEWQESERRALDDIAAGRTRTFANPTDAVRYLLGSSD